MGGAPELLLLKHILRTGMPLRLLIIGTYRDTDLTRAHPLTAVLADGERLARAALANARPGGFMASAIAVDEKLIALYEVASAALGEADSLLRARLLGQLAVELGYTPQRERRDALSRAALEIARRLGDRNGLAEVLILRLFAMNDPFTLRERLELTAELRSLAGDLGSSELAWHAAFHHTGALLESGDSGGAEQALTDVERLGGELRQPFYTWAARLGRAMLAILRGAQDAEAQILATSELGTAGGQPDAALAAIPQLFMVRYDQGRLGEFVDVERAIVEAQPHILPIEPPWLGSSARSTRSGRHASGSTSSERAASPARPTWFGRRTSLA